MCAEIYADYQRSLAYRGAVDFDDLIHLAYEAIRLDPDYLARLQHRWPYILEDEAQDSSKLQEEILQLLSATSNNWVRVGDTNQAIYETFTTANPNLLRAFLTRPGVQRVTLKQSGRSQQAIIDLANHLVQWACEDHPSDFVRGSAFVKRQIRPTDPGDPQPNPLQDRSTVQLIDQTLTPERELLAVADSLQRWLPQHPQSTVAVLAPRNQRGFDLIDLLKARDIPHVELLRSTSATRQTAGALGNILRCLADPTSARRLSVAFAVWRRHDRDDRDARTLVEVVGKRIRRCPAVEAYLWPRADHDWLRPLEAELTGGELALLTDFRDLARRWHRAASLPIDQLILTLAGDLLQESQELALAYKLAILLRDVARAHPSYRLAELVEELAVIARNQRRFLGFSSDDSSFEPPKGKVTVTTMHKAKGLEWDRVYLMSVNNYNFPSDQSHDTYISEPWYVRDSLNLEAEVLAQLDWIAGHKTTISGMDSGSGSTVSQDVARATHHARLEYAAERLRLLYVGITRAKSDLIVTWNTGRRRDAKLQPAAPFIALQDYLPNSDNHGVP
jgi:DNA helicase-2/ATP-dependent DNA helicase PcrA